MKKLFVIGLCCLILCGCNNSQTTINIKSVKSSLQSINEIVDICIVTEDNDPNGQLNKQGGYTDALFFALNSIDTSDIEGNNSCDIGTSGGGSIEIYSNEKDAKKRNDYLSTFDGSILADFHQIHNNIVIRISNQLNSTEQKDLYQQIISNLKDIN